MSKLNIITTIFCTTMLASCANVNVKKIPYKGDYQTWDDTKQAEADAITGVRYYLPRPYIAVEKEFPYNSETRLVHGEYSPATGLISIVNGVAPLKQNLLINPAIPVSVNDVYISRKSPLNNRIRINAQSDDENGNKETIASGPGDTGSNQQSVSFESKLSEKGGLVQWTVANTSFDIKGKNNLLKLKFKISTKDQLKDLSKKSVREVFLVKVKNGKPVKDSKVPLPLNFYKDDGNYEYIGVLPDLSNGLYVLGTTFYKINGNQCDTYHYYQSTDESNMINVGFNSDEIQYGIKIDPNIAPAGKFTKISLERLNQLTTPALGHVSFAISALKKHEVGAGNINKLTAVGLAPRKTDNTPDFTKAVYLPIEAVTEDGISGDKLGFKIKSLLPNTLTTEGDWLPFTGFDTSTGNKYIYGEQPAISVQKAEQTNDIMPVCEPAISTSSQTDSNPNSGTKNPSNDNGTINNNTPQQAVKPTSDTSNKPEVVATVESEEKVKSGGGTLSVTALTNPETKPVNNINEYFKLLYLPDDTQQYAVEAEANLSLSEVSLSLEHGWLMESFSAKIDNRAIANFFFMQFGETLDLVRDIVRLDKKLLTPVVSDKDDTDEDTTPANIEPQSDSEQKDRIPVLLKIHQIQYATPGLYPVLKAAEMKTKEHFSAVEFNTRNETLVELVKFNNE